MISHLCMITASVSHSFGGFPVPPDEWPPLAGAVTAGSVDNTQRSFRIMDGRRRPGLLQGMRGE
jgi:hypothetical protein